MQTLPTSEINKQIFYFFDFFKPMFSNAQFENFIIFVLGLLQNSKNKKVTDIAELTDNLKDHSVLSKFLSSKYFNSYKVKETLKKLFLQICDFTKPFYLYIDDSLVEKAGKKVKADWNHDSSTGGFLFSNCFVIGLIKNGKLEFPFDFKKYFQEKGENDKAYRSKLDLCLIIINRVISFLGKNTYVLFDSWYSAAKVINKLKKEEIKFITRLKSNRSVLPLKISLKGYSKRLKPKEFKEIKIGEKIYFIYSKFLNINKIGKIKILFCKKKRYSKNVIFLCTNSGLTDSEILENYIHRWEIEQFFSDTKEYLGLEDYQEIKQVAVSRHITLLFSTYFLISLILSFIEKCSSLVLTIGETLKTLMNRSSLCPLSKLNREIRKGISEVKLTLLRRLYQRKLEVNLC